MRRAGATKSARRRPGALRLACAAAVHANIPRLRGSRCKPTPSLLPPTLGRPRRATTRVRPPPGSARSARVWTFEAPPLGHCSEPAQRTCLRTRTAPLRLGALGCASHPLRANVNARRRPYAARAWACARALASGAPVVYACCRPRAMGARDNTWVGHAPLRTEALLATATPAQNCATGWNGKRRLVPLPMRWRRVLLNH